MEPAVHTLHDLFRQLGLPDESDDIKRFMQAHRPVPDGVKLADAAFWSNTQAQFLREQIHEDADWAEVIDQLNLMLRA